MVITTPKNLPQNLEIAVREDMAQKLEINSKLLQLTESQVAIWKDCLPDQSGFIRPEPCTNISRSGWRVTMSGQGENWVYYVTNDKFITLDTSASLNKAILSAISTKLALKPNQFRIAATQSTKGLPTCSINATCKVKPIFAWRILVEGKEKPFLMGLDGKDLKYENLIFLLPQQTEKKFQNINEKVLEDVVSRDEVLNSNLRIESIKFVTWNWCEGGNIGPSRPEMGICPNIEQSAWRMIVISGANRYVYYIPKDAISDPNFSPLPDGMQSLASSVITAIKKDAAKRGRVSVDMIGLLWISPKFFDRCLDVDNQKLNCHQSVQAGWQVTVVGTNNSNTSHSNSSAKWIYNVNLAGNDIRFLESGEWFPAP
ncbi:hypothetical protein VB713_15490 [Anabaena cylindrica UHCC 0172]|uniref:hypothetical protein n=1 Tax=Anabaena cylindrica TaxID=1165 RepID=UPI002B1F5CF3|nr:hypothetical protein [Anabaena cylindrica]MEA5552345.1 hypothetical protein [Anabaena cylindrica UHCC 0172]